MNNMNEYADEYYIITAKHQDIDRKEMIVDRVHDYS